MKNILIIISTLKKWWWAEKIASSLWTSLVKKWYNVSFLTFYNVKDKYKFEWKYYSLKQKILSSNDSFIKKIFLLLFKRILWINKIVQKNKINTCISFMEESNFPLILSKYFWNKSKIIVSVRQNPLIYWRVYKTLIKFLYPKANKVVTVTKAMESILSVNFSIINTKTIYNLHCVTSNIKKQKENIEKKYTYIFKWKWFIFSTIWRLNIAKWQWYLIRSFKKVVKKYPNSKLLIIWAWELENKLKLLITKLELENNIFLLWLQNNPLKFIKKTNSFVFSSLWEWLPNTLIEVLSTNIPIISTDCKTWPREILDPDLDINKTIKYPHYWKYWILIKTPKKEFIWEDLKEKSLIKEENLLADTMIKVIENKEVQKKYSYWLKRAFDFDNENIIWKWEEII